MPWLRLQKTTGNISILRHGRFSEKLGGIYENRNMDDFLIFLERYLIFLVSSSGARAWGCEDIDLAAWFAEPLRGLSRMFSRGLVCAIGCVSLFIPDCLVLFGFVSLWLWLWLWVCLIVWLHNTARCILTPAQNGREGLCIVIVSLLCSLIGFANTSTQKSSSPRKTGRCFRPRPFRMVCGQVHQSGTVLRSCRNVRILRRYGVRLLSCWDEVAHGGAACAVLCQKPIKEARRIW